MHRVQAIATIGDVSSFWHPFANMAETASRGRIVFVSGEGSHLTDSEGKRYFDASGGLWYNAVGHGRERIARAIAEQAQKIAATTCFDVYATDVTLEVADRIAALSPLEGARVFLTSGGSDSVDSAGKIIRRYFALRGEPERTVCIAREGAYHGMHAYGTSLAGIPGNHDGWGPLVREVEHVTAFNAEALEEKIREVGAERVAAFFAEPVIGAGGVFPPPEGYLPAVREVCDRHGVLLVCDEVVTGVGRLGRWTASERFGVRPDLIILAKILTSGYQPLGAVVVSSEVSEPFFDGDGAWLKHGYTYSGHATACAAAVANLEIMEEERLVDRVAEIEESLPRLLGPLAELEGISEVRAIGLLAGVQLDAPWFEERGVPLAEVAVAVRERGQLSRLLASGALQFSPPFVSTEEDIAGFAEATADALASFA
ncbi:MAG TPA: aminotransferase class III-fold pyridoxal phosphate-dependent enzyme [Solirubrobacterales bacterium]|jgi:adenosylmethionine-8-amino-7-oxononanoate aminotransferase